MTRKHRRHKKTKPIYAIEYDLDLSIVTLHNTENYIRRVRKWLEKEREKLEKRTREASDLSLLDP